MPQRRDSAEVVALREQLAYERERYDKLLAQFTALKRDGFAVKMEYEAPPPASPLPPAVLKALAQVSDPGTVERRELERRAADMVRAGMGEEAVADAVLDGESVEL